MEQNIKRCPYCGENINLHAMKCPYCCSWLVKKTEENYAPISPNISESTVNSSRDGLERFLDKATCKCTNIYLLKWLCIAGIIFSLYDCILMRIDVDAYYRSSFIKCLVWIEKNLHWLLTLLEGTVDIGILLAIRRILIKYGVKSLISLCIVAFAAYYIFESIASDTIISYILGVSCAILSIEYGYKMSRSQISDIKNVGYMELFTSAFLLAYYILIPLMILFALSENTGEKELRWLSFLTLFVSVVLYKLLYKLFKKEYSEKQ